MAQAMRAVLSANAAAAIWLLATGAVTHWLNRALFCEPF
jgi:hypothetical protein